jgi:hypothetical protein
MKELSTPIQDKVKGEVSVVRQVESHTLVQREKLKPGHHVWELNVAEGLIRRAKIEEVNAVLGEHGIEVRRKVIRQDGCLYVNALNAMNADKKFLKMILLDKMLNRK